MVKKIKLLLVLIALFFVESVFLASVPWNGTVAPLVFTAGLAVSVVSDEWDTILAALVTGFLADLYTTHFFGVNMLLNLYVFLALYWIKGHLRQEKNWLMAVVMTALALIRYSLHFLLNHFTGLPQNFAAVPRLTLMALLMALPILILTRRFLTYQSRTARRV